MFFPRTFGGDSEKLTLQKTVAPKVEIFTRQEASEMLECLENEE